MCHTCMRQRDGAATGHAWVCTCMTGTTIDSVTVLLTQPTAHVGAQGPCRPASAPHGPNQHCGAAAAAAGSHSCPSTTPRCYAAASLRQTFGEVGAGAVIGAHDRVDRGSPEGRACYLAVHAEEGLLWQASPGARWVSHRGGGGAAAHAAARHGGGDECDDEDEESRHDGAGRAALEICTPHCLLLPPCETVPLPCKKE